MNINVWQALISLVTGTILIAGINLLWMKHKMRQDVANATGEEPPKLFRSHSIREPEMWRAWLTINDPEYMHKGVDFHWEFIWGKKARSVGPGFRIHLGDRGSETPFHWDILLGFVGVFFSMNTPKMGELFERIGRGHKRDIALRFHNGQMWWNLWYDDDGGYDNSHPDHRHDVPKLWPFRNKKFRSWACLRQGNLPFNPLTVWWGGRFYKYENVDEDVLLIEINQFKGDEYMVEFKVQEVTRARRSGPTWARGYSHEGYTAEWYCKDGIPYRNEAWKGDCCYGSAVKIPDPTDWRMDADDNLKAWVKDQRRKYGYRNPEEILKSIKSATPIFDAMEGQFLQLGKAAGNARVSIEAFTDKFEEQLKKAGAMIILPDEGGKITSALENEKLKSMYTPEEMAQQVINRDKED